MVEIIVASIGSISAILVAFIGMRKISKEGWEKTANAMTTSLAVFETKLEELTREVRLHNNFASEIPLLKSEIARQDKEIANLKSDVKNLEKTIAKMGGV